MQSKSRVRKLITLLVILSGTLVSNLRAQQDPNVAEQSAMDTGRLNQAGPVYVELDSWIYPALARLAALGYIHTEFLGMRPWTRVDCARMVQTASMDIEGKQSTATAEAGRLYGDLKDEFRAEIDTLEGQKPSSSLKLESLYTNVTGITGRSLNDSYHFGQSIINNSGRPFEQGFNNWSGFSGYAATGRFAIYMRGEFQHAPSAPAYSTIVRESIASMDNNPVQPAVPVPPVNQFRLLDTYVTANLAGWDLSFGKQSLWWGPGEGGALLFSDNAEPIYMFRASRTTPFVLPLILRYLGPMKLDFFLGKLSGNEFPPRPLIHGEKISFKPTPNIEFGFSRTAELGGVGRPVTALSVWRSYFIYFRRF